MTEVVDTAVIYRTTPREAVKKGLNEVVSFRSFQRRMKGNTELSVNFIPESQWLDEWRFERRIAIVFEPTMAPGSNSLEMLPPDMRLSRLQSTSLILTEFSQHFPHVAWNLDRLRNVRFTRHSYPFLWKGSGVKIEEERTPYDSGRGPMPTHTSVDAGGFLAAPTYDFLSDQLRTRQHLISTGETIWLALSFPFGSEKIPQPTNVGPNGVAPNPGLIEQNTPRLCLQLAHVPIVEPRHEAPKPTTLEQWMAIEQSEG